jgi:hypothetical protein
MNFTRRPPAHETCNCRCQTPCQTTAAHLRQTSSCPRIKTPPANSRSVHQADNNNTLSAYNSGGYPTMKVLERLDKPIMRVKGRWPLAWQGGSSNSAHNSTKRNHRNARHMGYRKLPKEEILLGRRRKKAHSASVKAAASNANSLWVREQMNLRWEVHLWKLTQIRRKYCNIVDLNIDSIVA